MGKNNKKPCAWITSKKNRYAIKHSINNNSPMRVYMNNDENFEIEIFNPTRDNILCRIKIQKNNVTDGGLVIRPGQRFYLDCDVKTKKKFTFSTYSIDSNDKEAMEAILNNGIIEVSFYKEKNHSEIVDATWYIPYTRCSDYDFHNKYDKYKKELKTSLFNQQSLGGSDFKSSEVTLDGLDFETGRIEMKGKSDQNFMTIDMEFDNTEFLNYKYIILPESRKPIETKDLVKYCFSCGKKTKKNDNFCSKCGTEL